VVLINGDTMYRLRLGLALVIALTTAAAVHAQVSLNQPTRR
jgi:hypothetical protein